MSKKYFKLYAECYLIPNNNRAALYNLIEKKIIWMSKENTEALLATELNNPVSENNRELYDILSKEGWGVYSDEKIFTDKLRNTNIYNEKKFHKSTPYINYAILQLTSECNLNCIDCTKFFCPTCKKQESSEKVLSTNEFKKVIDTLDFYGTSNVILTGGEVGLYKDLDVIIDYLKEKNINILITTNGINKINCLDKELPLFINIFDYNKLDRIYENYKDFKNVTLNIYDNNVSEANIEKYKRSTWKFTKSYSFEPVISKENITGVDVNQFNNRKIFDSCLMGKICILHNGNITPCLHSKDIIGNIETSDFSEVLKTLVMDYWRKSVDMRNTKCASCEFRYGCTSCIYSDVKNNCKYNTEVNKWI